MEAAAASPFLAPTNQRWPLRLASAPQSLSTFSPQSLISIRFEFIQSKQRLRLKGTKRGSLTALKTHPTDSPLSDSSERWVLESVGNGDYRHIGVKVPLPSSFEMASNVVTVGRLPEKADMVIPVATGSVIGENNQNTRMQILHDLEISYVGRDHGNQSSVNVSALHARLEKKEGALLVTDMGSTNGTFINDKKLRPGDAATASPGSFIVFGDTNLAMFRVSKVEATQLTSNADESKIKVMTDLSINT